MFEIDLKKIFPAKIVKPESVAVAIEKVQCAGRPTFGKVLVELGLTYADFEKMKVSESRFNLQSAHMLELFKQHLENEMEERLIYQDNLPRFYRHDALQFVMKKTNPARYGDKVLEIQKKTEKTAKSPLDDLENTSGFSISEKVVS